MDVTVVIVNYNSGDYLRACVRSLREHIQIPHEIVVVDNESTDSSLEGLLEGDDLRLIRAGNNLGFAKACNLGARQAKGRVIHFLNPDAHVTNNIQEAYNEALLGPRGIYVTRILDLKLKSERSSHPFPIMSNIFWAVFNPERVKVWYIGASVIMSREVYRDVGGWSEDYFMYGEDTDLFYKAYLLGLPVVKTRALVVHAQGGSTDSVWSSLQILERGERAGIAFARKFGLGLDYFMFKHAAFLKVLLRDPGEAWMALRAYWRVFLGFSR